MAFNPNIKTTYNFVDEHNLMLCQNEPWGGDNGRGDCIGRTLDAYMAYEYEPFIQAVKNCFVFKTDNKGKTYIQGFRHPSYVNIEYNNMSRDHIINSLILMKLVNDEFLQVLAKNLRWKISDRFTFTPDLWLYMKGIAGNKFSMFLYYVAEFFVVLIGIGWSKIIYKLAGFNKEMPQDEFTATPHEELSEEQKKYRSWLFPRYTLCQKSQALYVAPNSLGKWLIKKICLWGVDKENYFLRIMFGGKVDKEKIYSYKPMTNWRWSTYLNEINDRGSRVITDPALNEANTLDVDILVKMYERLNSKK